MEEDSYCWMLPQAEHKLLLYTDAVQMPSTGNVDEGGNSQLAPEGRSGDYQ